MVQATTSVVRAACDHPRGEISVTFPAPFEDERIIRSIASRNRRRLPWREAPLLIERANEP
jgi:hypothetical protein